MFVDAKDAVAAQRRYYTESASRYDDMHAHEVDGVPRQPGTSLNAHLTDSSIVVRAFKETGA